MMPYSTISHITESEQVPYLLYAKAGGAKSVREDRPKLTTTTNKRRTI